MKKGFPRIKNNEKISKGPLNKSLAMAARQLAIKNTLKIFAINQ